jgi:hypothetical protein
MEGFGQRPSSRFWAKLSGDGWRPFGGPIAVLMGPPVPRSRSLRKAQP